MKNYFKAFALLVVFMLLTHCEKENSLIESNVFEEVNSLKKNEVKYLTSHEIPNVITSLNAKTKSIFASSKKSNDYGNLDFDNILQVIDTLENANYTFKILNVKPIDNSEIAFYNLIVNTDSLGNANAPLVLKYTLERDFALAYLNNEKNFDDYKGKVTKYSVATFLSKYTLLKGGEDCPEEDIIDNTGTTTSGGPTDGDPNSGEGGTVTGGGSVVCGQEIVGYEQCGCGGRADGHSPSGAGCCSGSPAIYRTQCTLKSSSICPDLVGPYGVLTNLTLDDKLKAILLTQWTSDVGEVFSLLNDQAQLQQAIIDFLNENNSQEALDLVLSALLTNNNIVYDRIDDDRIAEEFNKNDLEPVKAYAGTILDFKNILDNSPRGVGKFKGKEASDYLRNLGNTKFNWKQMRPLPTQTGFFNSKVGRYIYTKKGGWIDMAHFMFYAGKAYDYKLDGEQNPIGEAVQDGYKQEISDEIVATHSAYSYEDLPSDRFGAIFAVNHFDSDSDLTFSEQLQNYFRNVLEAVNPSDAPNFDNIPSQDSRNIPSRTNRTTIPVYTTTNP